MRLQFWNFLRILCTFLYFALGAMAAIDFAGLMPEKLLELVNSRYSLEYVRFIPPEYRRLWIPLALGALMCALLSFISARRKLFWRPPGFATLSAPNGGYLRKAGYAQLKREIAKTKPPREKRGQVKKSFKLGERYFAENQYRKAAAEFQKSSAAFPTMSASLNEGVSLCYISYFQKAIDAFNMGRAIAGKKQNEDFGAAFESNFCIPRRELGNLEAALANFKESYSTCMKFNDSLGRICALGNLGTILLAQGKPDEALKSWHDVLEGLKEVRCNTGLAAALDNTGRAYSEKREFKKALEHHRKAFKLYKGIRDLSGKTHALANVGRVYLKLDKLWKSIRINRRALGLAARLGSFLDRARINANIAQAHAKKGKLDDALKSAERALELYEKIDNRAGAASQLSDIGVIYASLQKKDDALRKMAEARAKYSEIGAEPEVYRALEARIKRALTAGPPQKRRIIPFLKTKKKQASPALQS